jgi:hypothetical protein
MKIKGFLLRISLLLLSQKMQIIFYVRVVGENIIQLYMKDILRYVLISLINQKHF